MGGNKTVSVDQPKISDFQVQTSGYGRANTAIFGRTRVAGNIIDYVDFTAIPHTSNQGSGGKGGSASTQTTDYSYTVGAVIAIGAGDITVYRCILPKNDTLKNDSLLNMATYRSAPWPYMQGKHPERALNYHGITYIAGIVDLGNSGSMPQVNWEVGSSHQFGGGVYDANPKVIIEEILTNPLYQVDFAALGDLTKYNDYCVANGLFISLALEEQLEIRELITTICMITNSQPVFSQGKLKIVPYGDEMASGHGVTFTPDNTPLYDLDDNDFIVDGDELPVRHLHSNPADACNVVKVEFLNRANDYNVDMVKADDPASITDIGMIPADPIQLHYITERSVALLAAQLILKRKLYVRNKYEFKLSWKYSLLEPMDIVTITRPSMGLDHVPVRITTIEENDECTLSFTVEECPPGIGGAARYPSQDTDNITIDYQVSPGSVNSPVIFEPPMDATKSALETWVAVSGSDPNWGGCFIYASEDGTNYKRIGVVNAKARQGLLSAILPVGSAVDDTNILAVDLTQSEGQLNSGTEADKTNLNTLCMVGGELVSYQTATLAAPNKYSLTHLVRGAYGTPILSHESGTAFVRLDDAIFKYQLSKGQIGKTLYFKFQSFNVYGGGVQEIATCTAYQHTILSATVQEPSNLQVSEFSYTGSDGIIISGLRVTFKPADYFYYLHTLIRVSDDGGDTFRDVTTSVNGDVVIPGSVGKTYKVQAITISTNNMPSQGVISTAVTITGNDLAPKAPANLSADWTTADLKLVWDAVCTNSDDTQAFDIRDYKVEIYVDGVNKRTEYTVPNGYAYTIEKNFADNTPAATTITANVYCRDNKGNVSLVTSLSKSSLAPAAPSLSAAPGTGRIKVVVGLTSAQMLNFGHIEIKASQVTGFDPESAGTLIHDNPDTVYDHSVDGGSKWYYRARMINRLGQPSPWSAEINCTAGKVEETDMNPQILLMKTSSQNVPSAGSLANIHDGSPDSSCTLSGGWVEDRFVGQQIFSTLRIMVLAGVQFYAQYTSDIGETAVWTNCCGTPESPKQAQAGKNIFQIQPFVSAQRLRIVLLAGATIQELRFGTVGQADDFYFEKATGDQIEVNSIKIGTHVQATDSGQNIDLSKDKLFHFDNHLISTQGLQPNAGYDAAIVTGQGKRGNAVKVNTALSYNAGVANKYALSINSKLEASFDRGSIAYKSDGSQVAVNQPRFESSGILVEYAATNLLNDPLMNALTGWSVTNGGTLALVNVSPNGKFPAGATSCLSGTVISGQVSCYILHNIALTATKTYTLSVWAYVPANVPAEKARLSVLDSSFVTVSYISIAERDQWVRKDLTFTVPADGTYKVGAGLSNAGEGFTSYACLAQVEQNPYPTSFMAGSRYRELLTIPTGGMSIDSGSIEWTFTPRQPASGVISQSTSPKILMIGDYFVKNNVNVWAFVGSPGQEPSLMLYVKGSTNPSWSMIKSVILAGSGWYTVGVPIHFRLTWTNGSNFCLWVNGIKHGPYILGDPLTAIGNIILSGAASAPNGIYDDVRLSCIARNDIPDLTTVLPVDEYTTAKYNFSDTLDSEYINCIITGDITKQDASFSRNSIAFRTDGTRVSANVPRYEAGPFERGIMIEEGFTQYSPETSWACGNYGGSTGTISVENDGEGYIAISDLTVVNDYPRIVNSTFGPITGDITIEFDAKVNTAGATILASLQSSGGTKYISPAIELTTEWKRYILTINTAYAMSALYFRPQNSGVIYGLRRINVLNKPYALSYYNAAGTRPGEQLTIPVAGLSPKEGAWEQSVCVNDGIKRTTTEYPVVFALKLPNKTDTAAIMLSHYNGDWQLFTYDGSGSGAIKEVAISDSVTPNGWHRFKVTWNSNEANLYIDNVLHGTIAHPILPVTFYERASIGYFDETYKYYSNTCHADVRLSSIARADLSDLTKPLPIDEYTIAKYDFNGTLSHTVDKWVNGNHNPGYLANFVTVDSIGKVTLSGPRYYDELYITPRQINEDTAKVWLGTGAIFNDPSPIIRDDNIASAVNWNLTKDQTVNYRTAGSPSNVPSTGAITVTKNVNGTLDIRIAWNAYVQGTLKADFLMLFWKSGPAAGLGAAAVNDASVCFNVNTGNTYYDLEGVAPKYFSFGIAACRRTENGIEIGAIQSPVAWQDINGTGATYTADIVPISAGSGSVKIDNTGVWGYTGTTKRAGFGTDGKWMAGTGALIADESGLHGYNNGAKTFDITNTGSILDATGYPLIDINGKVNGKLITSGYLSTANAMDDIPLGNITIPQGRKWILVAFPNNMYSLPRSNTSKQLKNLGYFYNSGGAVVAGPAIEYDFWMGFSADTATPELAPPWNVLNAGTYVGLNIFIHHQVTINYQYTDGTFDQSPVKVETFYQIMEYSV